MGVSPRLRKASRTNQSDGIVDETASAPAITRANVSFVSSCHSTQGKLLLKTCRRWRSFAQAPQCVQDMDSLMRSNSMGGRGAVPNGHRERPDAPVCDMQAHAGQQRTDGAAMRDQCGCNSLSGRSAPRQADIYFFFVRAMCHGLSKVPTPCARGS